MIELSRKSNVRKYTVNEECLLNEDDISFYLLGAYMTDGCLNDKKHSVSFSISSKDIDWLDEIKKYLCPEKPIYKYKNCYSFKLSNINCMNWLFQYGCTPRKSYSLNIEKEIPEKYHRDFIRGLIDGDGCLTSCKYLAKRPNKTYTYTKHSLYLCSASENFLKQIKDMIPKDINCNIYNRGKTNAIINGRDVIAKTDLFKLTFNDSNALKMAKWLYFEGNNISLKRKEDIANKWLLAQNLHPDNLC